MFFVVLLVEFSDRKFLCRLTCIVLGWAEKGVGGVGVEVGGEELHLLDIRI